MDDLRKIIEADLYRHNCLKGTKGFLKGWFQPGFRYTFLFRKTQRLKKTTLRGVFYRMLKMRYSFKYGYQISADAQIGEGFYLSDHFGTVVIGPVTIGKNCNVNHSVTIGRAYKGGIIGRPKIDDYVWIGTGSVLVGDIKIGKNVLIAPNSFVNFDVPDNSIVIGNPGKIINKENPTRNYINNVLNE
jgi:serine O-acetyltransferase